MQISDQGTLDIYDGDDTQAARRRLPAELHDKAARLLDRINAAHKPSDLAIPRGNRLEQLSGSRAGEWSIRINDQYRLCFRWTKNGPEDVELVDYH